MKIQTVCIVLAVCLSGVPAIGQTPTAQPLVHCLSDGSYRPPTPEQLGIMEQAGQLAHDAAADLHARNYIQAEAEARQSLSLLPDFGVPAEVLAASLEGQGKDQEALQAYHIMVVDQGDRFPRNLLPYAGLLLKSGQWTQAVAAYNQALPHLPDVGPHLEATIVHDGDVIRANSHFSPDVPEPLALATAIHIARGIVYNNTPNWGNGAYQDTEAMAEYAKALQTAPGNALANYYYGVGWHKLSPTDRVKFGTAQQAKAALQKAVKIGNANVKAAALKALKNAG